MSAHDLADAGPVEVAGQGRTCSRVRRYSRPWPFEEIRST
jgi:hypothetical protein